MHGMEAALTAAWRMLLRLSVLHGMEAALTALCGLVFRKQMSCVGFSKGNENGFLSEDFLISYICPVHKSWQRCHDPSHS